jgi:hypothetical protein
MPTSVKLAVRQRDGGRYIGGKEVLRWAQEILRWAQEILGTGTT